jgi:hypothetical protein
MSYICFIYKHVRSQYNINYSGISQVYNYHKYEDTTRPACYKLKSTHGFIFKDA